MMFLVVTHVLERIPTAHRTSVLEIINQPKSTPSQRRAALLKKGLLRSVVDELEALTDGGMISRISLSVLVYTESLDTRNGYRRSLSKDREAFASIVRLNPTRGRASQDYRAMCYSHRSIKAHFLPSADVRRTSYSFQEWGVGGGRKEEQAYRCPSSWRKVCRVCPLPLL